MHVKLLNVSLGSSEFSLFIGLLYVIMEYYFRVQGCFLPFAVLTWRKRRWRLAG